MCSKFHVQSYYKVAGKTFKKLDISKKKFMSVLNAQFIGDHESENRIKKSQRFVKILKIL